MQGERTKLTQVYAYNVKYLNDMLYCCCCFVLLLFFCCCCFVLPGRGSSLCLATTTYFLRNRTKM